MNTINTINKNIPNPYIVLLECSNDIKKYEIELKKNVDEYHNYCNNKKVLDAVNSIYKNYGEVMTLIEFFNNFKNIDKMNDLFKITGRYWLNENFNIRQIIKLFEKKYNVAINIKDYKKNLKENYSQKIFVKSFKKTGYDNKFNILKTIKDYNDKK